MSRREKQLYCKVGQAVCNITGAMIVMAMFIAPILVGGYICNIIL